jgi:hypothetical protein
MTSCATYGACEVEEITLNLQKCVVFSSDYHLQDVAPVHLETVGHPFCLRDQRLHVL